MNIADEINRSIPIRRAFIWDRIIRLGFSPLNETDKNSWVLLFKKNLYSFWGIENLPDQGRFSATEINLTYPSITGDGEMSFICNIGTDDRFSVNVMGTNLWWLHEYDGRYYVPSTNVFLPTLSRYTRADSVFSNIERGDVEVVVDGLISHPCTHQHIIHPVVNHEIRFGGGITNPFLFLFHLRYQLCTDEERRDREQSRLVELFYNAITNNQTRIPPNELMSIP